MLSPYGMEIVESCITCKLRADRIFCDLPPTALQNFENIKFATAYPQGAVLFVEGQLPRGIFVLCKGGVKLSINSPSGRTMIVKLAEPGEVLGLSATISGKPYRSDGRDDRPLSGEFRQTRRFSQISPKKTWKLASKWRSSWAKSITMPARKCARWDFRTPRPRSWRSCSWNGVPRTVKPANRSPG